MVNQIYSAVLYCTVLVSDLPCLISQTLSPVFFIFPCSSLSLLPSFLFFSFLYLSFPFFRFRPSPTFFSPLFILVSFFLPSPSSLLRSSLLRSTLLPCSYISSPISILHPSLFLNLLSSPPVGVMTPKITHAPPGSEAYRIGSNAWGVSTV